ncbi:accessory gene regulator B family protein [Paenibacillus sp. Leaf72]|uniref:accessory gene regulator B family protein n=1 Tax=Paenibacillus sp. Leaf72 TaxID=1736234 RepID=UPI0006F55C07|nr:accessory gene regulator B family protein [Paenibacillus sp. Leaf72]KQN96988.1 hypothetical protein ASF12_23250 [Paenibacillus sp. Leaf72]
MTYWLSVVISIFLSTLEITMILSLTFRLFRFQTKIYYNSMVLIGLVLSYISYEIREEFHLQGWDTVVQCVLLFLILRFVYRVGFFYAGCMIIKGVALFTVLQAIAAFVLTTVKMYELDYAISALNVQAYILQILTVGLSLFILYVLRRLNIGFTYVPYSPREAVIFNGVNRKILIHAIFTFGIFLFSVFAVTTHNFTAFYCTVLIMLVMFVLLFRLSYEKEYEDESEEESRIQKSIIETIADSIARWIYLNNQGKHVSENVLRYFLLNTIPIIAIIIFSLLLGLIFQHTTEVLLSLIGLGILRFFSGGHHMSTPLQCIIVSTLIIMSSSLLVPPVLWQPYIWATIVIIVLIFSPSIPGDMKFSMRKKLVYKVLSILIVSFGYFIDSEVLLMTFMLQVCTLLPIIKIKK